MFQLSNGDFISSYHAYSIYKLCVHIVVCNARIPKLGLMSEVRARHPTLALCELAFFSLSFRIYTLIV